jgi:hypothetical protein
MFRRWYWRVMTLGADRGEGPVPYIIIVAIMAGAAVLIALGVSGLAEDWLGKLEEDAAVP